LTCWFGSAGPLKGTHIYHAEAEPPSKGGRAEIEVHTKDSAATDPRSLRAYRVTVVPGPERPQLEIENITMPEPLATHMTADVNRWAAGEEGCGDGPVTTGWSPQPVSSSREAIKGSGHKAKP
jgi:hypothetical protein